MTAGSDIRALLDKAIGAFDRPGAVDVALTALDSGSIRIDALYDVLSDILADIGASWQRGTAEVWQEHFATAIVRTIVESCALRIERQAPADRSATVVLAAPSDEYHDLGLRMLADRFTLAGWRAQLLGANVPLPEVLAAIDALSADAVALSASTHFHRLELRAYSERIASEHPNVRQWVGGPAFVREHDGWPDELILDAHSVPRPDER